MKTDLVLIWRDINLLCLQCLSYSCHLFSINFFICSNLEPKSVITTHQFYLCFISSCKTYISYFSLWGVYRVSYNAGHIARFSGVAHEHFEFRLDAFPSTSNAFCGIWTLSFMTNPVPFIHYVMAAPLNNSQSGS